MKIWKVVDVGSPVVFDGNLAAEAKDYFTKARKSGGIAPQVKSKGSDSIELLRTVIPLQKPTSFNRV